MFKAFWIISSIVISGALFFTYVFYHGPPGGKSNASQEFVEYLEEKYDEEFVVDDIYYDFFTNGTYHAWVYPKERPDYLFYIGQLRNHEIDETYRPLSDREEPSSS
ncbi:hypothetical protein CR194_04345 [Salipaludibacillus keqinensis]|uniref:YfjL-like N-terminal domain-containing protein n=1 Tax=Salipaludibacillus keqinensis TaxID=2045207 RepID=A0A323TKX2_9BACI|nr:hypothetical protein [Salipaludibacillus keqinensis]PYZ94766.1 hypothetical protein CR194_04345 [Salipaludibacillus keqinensis]